MVRIVVIAIIFFAATMTTENNGAIALDKMNEVPRVTKDELKAMLASPDLLLLDVRTHKDWNDSEFKIQGAERKDPAEFDRWKDQLPTDKTLVMYCA